VVVPPGPLLDPAALARPATAPAAPAGIPLRQLVAESTLVVDGVVAKVESLDDGRLALYRVRPRRVLRGSTDADMLAVVEIRGTATRPGWLAEGVRAVLLLRPAPPLSYLAQHLPDGPRYAPTGGRDGIVHIADDADREAIAGVLDEGARIAVLKNDDEARSARRALAFRELANGSPRLVADALAELRLLEGTPNLTPDEVAALTHALAAKGVAPFARAGLVRLFGQRHLVAALPAVKATLVDDPDVLDAVLEARAALGAPADRGELTGYLSSKDPAVRASALRALARLPEPAVGDLGHYATSDPDTGVRVAAIEAMGTTKKPAALPVLSQTFATSSREIRQASGRAILAIGGDPASDALVELALHGKDTQTQTYAALLLLASRGRESAPVDRLLAAHPSQEVVDVLQKGVRWTHAHNQPEE
jgi:HEAT repeat protein